MAHYRRKRARTRSGFGGMDRERLKRLEARGLGHLFLGGTPTAWNILHHTRPARRETARLERLVLAGADVDVLTWPLGRRCPCEYYW